MRQTFYSNGKLLITGEYAVLDGARALALPTKFGQDLVVEEGKNKEIVWKSFDKDGSIWSENTIPFSIITSKTFFENQSKKNTLIGILHEAYLLNPDFVIYSEGYIITTHLTFPKFWGLGTSSTLINNIAQWISVDAFSLLKNSFGGSGYDIACAQYDCPILYQLVNGKPTVTKVDFCPPFSEKIYFVYLNKKQSSKNAIANYYKKQKNAAEFFPEIEKINQTLLNSKDSNHFAEALKYHETIMSELLDTKTIKELLFPDFSGTIKSLGAWGGDFVLVLSEENPTAYFKEKGYETILTFKEMIL